MTPRPAGDYVLVCDKPAGVTSHDVVAAVRRELPRRTRVGHAGTLDPFATGVLLVLVGRATRAQRFLMALPKAYEADARFGAVSDTGDPEGEITPTGRVPTGDLELPTGTLRQRPPAYSAVKVGGRRAYALARAGESVELAEREVTVSRFTELSRSADGARRRFAIECSSGTYVRSLIAELGDAYCEALRRTAVGPFAAADADPERPIALFDALAFLPELHVGAEAGRSLAHGRRLPGAQLGGAGIPAAGSVVRVSDPAGPVAVGEIRPDEGEGKGEGGGEGPRLAVLVGLRG